MADQDEKTEEPTQNKLQEARKDGDVAKSMDLSGFIALCVAFLALFLLGKFILETMYNNFIYSFSFIPHKGLNLRDWFAINLTFYKDIALAVLPLAVILTIAGVLGMVVQIGFLFSTKPIKPDLKKIDPIKGLKNLFSMQKVVESLKITAKVTVSFIVGAYFTYLFIQDLPTVQRLEIQSQILWLLEKILIIVFIMLLVFLVFGVIDYVIVKKQYIKKLRMSKKDIKDEYKKMEGDPLVKAQIRKKQQEMVRNTMMKDMESSDVVITNPTHYAIAMSYKEGDAGPKVMAKGIDHLAIMIKDKARQHSIPIIEDPSLARDLYASTDIGAMIPERLFAAVAKIFATVRGS